MSKLTNPPRIYVACLAAYNNGMLHGAWIDAAQDSWDIWAEIDTMLTTSPVADAEEYAIHDYEGFEGAPLSENTGIEQVVELAAFIQEHGILGAALLNNLGGDLVEARGAMADRYMGRYRSAADFMQDTTEAAAAVPDHLASYIDWEAMARDAEMNGDITTIALSHGEVHVFAG